MKNFLQRWLAFAILLTGVAALLFVFWRLFTTTTTTTTTKSSSLPLMTVAADIWPGNYWVVVADKKGFFKEAGLNVKVVDVSPDYNASITDVAEGRLDTTLMTIYDLVNQNVLGSHLVGVLQADTSQGAEGIVALPENKTLQDLKGKKIGVETGTYLDYYLKIALGRVNMTTADYQKINAKTEDLDDLLQRKEVDAIITWDPLLTELREAGNNILFSTSDIRGFSPDLFVFRKDFIDYRGEDVSRFMQAWLKTIEFIEHNSAEAYLLVSQFPFGDRDTLYTPEEVSRLTQSDRIADIVENIAAFSFGSGYASFYSQAQGVAWFMQRRGVIPQFPDINAMFDPRFIYRLPIPYE